MDIPDLGYYGGHAVLPDRMYDEQIYGRSMTNPTQFAEEQDVNEEKNVIVVGTVLSVLWPSYSHSLVQERRIARLGNSRGCKMSYGAT